MTYFDKVKDLELHELGYTESKTGWTKYGQWYADTIAHNQAFACGDWCVMFQTWAMLTAGVPDWPTTSPQGSAVEYLAEWFDARGYRTPANDMPRPGDIAMYSWSEDPDDLDHVGMVYSVQGSNADNARLKVVEGNYVDRVAWRYIFYRDPRLVRTYRLPCMDADIFPALSFMLRRGDSGDAVELLQAGLIYRGYDIYGGVDGVFGSETETALLRYQTDNGITADGKAGTETFTHLMGGFE